MGGATGMNCIDVQWRYESDITRRQILHSSKQGGWNSLFKWISWGMEVEPSLVEVTAQLTKMNMKNGKFVCQLGSVKHFSMSNSVYDEINISLFQHIIVEEI